MALTNELAPPSNQLATATPDLAPASPALSRALAVLHTIVEPDVLATIAPPHVYVHADGDRSHTRWLADLAIDAPGAAAIHVDASDPADVILHALGHVIERDLSIDDWLALQRLLRARHAIAARATSDTLIRLHVPPPWPGAPDPAAFRAVMPAYGAFSARASTTGATELLATSLELLANDPRRLIERDPLLAAIVLRILAPTELGAILDPDLLALLP